MHFFKKFSYYWICCWCCLCGAV